MEEFAFKFKRIFIPFVIITIATLCLYSLINWFLFINTESFDIDDNDINILGPMIFTWIPILIWLRPRIKLLQLKDTRKFRAFTGYLMLSWVIIAATLSFSQQYLGNAAGKLTRLDHISQIDSLPKTKYYTLKHFYIDKKLVRMKPVFNVSDKGRSYDMYIYAPCPIFDANLNVDTAHSLTFGDNKDTIKYSRPAAWLSVSYWKSISNNSSSNVKDSIYKQFERDCAISFEAQDFNSFTYLSRINRTRDFFGCKEAILSRDTSGQNPITILSPVNQSYELRNGNKLSMMLASFGIGCTVFLLLLLLSPLKNNSA